MEGGEGQWTTVILSERNKLEEAYQRVLDRCARPLGRPGRRDGLVCGTERGDSSGTC